MTESVRSAWPWKRCGLAVTCIAGVLLHPVSSRAAPPLTFRWPVPSRVGVTTITETDTTTMVTHEVAHLYATPHPGELKLQSEEPHVVDFVMGSSRTPRSMIDDIMEMASNEPPMTISRDGAFLGCHISDEYLAQVESWIRKKIGAVPDTTLLKQFLELYRSPEMRAKLEAKSGEVWNTWVGQWIESTLDPGMQVDARIPLPWVSGTIESDVRFQNHGPTRTGGRLDRLYWEARTTGEEARRTFERALRETLSKMPALGAPSGPALLSVTRTTTLEIVLDRVSMQPNYVYEQTQLDLQDSAGVHSRKEATSYFFEWDPPLAAALDPVSPAGRSAFLENRLPDAYVELRTDVEDGTRNPETYAYLAETCRRLGQLGEGVLFARRALALDPRHAFAHEVLGDCYNSQYGPWPLASPDSTWTHLLLAVECDSTDGNAWLGIFLESSRRGRTDLEQRSLSKLLETGFLMPPVLARARWMLQDLPDSAVLVTNGDMDSYPLWALQMRDRLRPDVAVVNRSLLQAPWYARMVRDRLRVPLPFADSVLDSLTPQRAGSNIVYVSDQIIRGWMDQQASGTFRRPLAFAITVSEDGFPPGFAARSALAGPVYLCRATPAPSTVDTTAIRVSLGHARASDFAGPHLSERDRSPVRRAAVSPAEGVVEMWFRYADALGRAGRRRECLKALEKTSAFAIEAGTSPAWREMMAKMRAQYSH